MRFLKKTIQYAILVFVFLIPWQARWILVSGELNGGYWEYGTQVVYVTELLWVVIIILLVVYIVQNHGIAELRRRIVQNCRIAELQKRLKRILQFRYSTILKFYTAIAVFIAWSGVSILWATNKAVALEHWVILVEAGVVFFIIASGIIPAKKIWYALIASALVQAGIATAEFLYQTIPASTYLGIARQSARELGTSVVETGGHRWLRAYGTFSHPNIAGGFLSLAIILFVRDWVRTAYTTWYQPIIYVSSFLLLVFGLLTTFSRSAWIACVMGFVILGIQAVYTQQGRTMFLKAIGYALCVLILFSAVYSDPLFARLGVSGRLEYASMSERADSINEAQLLLFMHPIFGVGIGNYTNSIATKVTPNKESWHYQPVHVIPLLVWTELGLVGLFIAFYGLWLMALRLFRAVNIFESILFLFPLLVLLLFDHYLWSFYSGLMIGACWFGYFYLILGKKYSK